jgi:hypothetical protein
VLERLVYEEKFFGALEGIFEMPFAFVLVVGGF